MLVAAGLLGGSSRPDAPTLLALRPLSVILLGYGLLGLTSDHLRTYRWLFGFAAVWIGLIILQLVPLPPSVWRSLPGRESVAAASDVVGMSTMWRPFSMVPWRGWNALFALAAPLAVLVLAVQCPPRALRTLVPIVLAIGVASALAGVVQAARGSGGWTWLYPITTGWAPPGLFANRNHQAVMLASMLPQIVWWTVGADPRRSRRPAALLAGSLTIAALFALILVTGSRAGLIAAVMTLAATPLVLPPGLIGGRIRWFALAAVAIVAVLVMALLLSRAAAIDRLLTMSDVAEPRLRYWPASRDAAELVFPVGAGVGSFVEVFQVTEPGYMLAPTYLNHAHNELIEVAIEAGVAGLAIVAGGLAAFAVAVLRAWRSRHLEPARLALSGGIAMFALGLGSLVDYPMRVPSLACLFALASVWLVAGAGARE